MLVGVWRTVRGANWWCQKVPPLLAVLYAGIVVFEPVPAAVVLRALGGLAGIVLVAAFGYVVNDVCDAAGDRPCGRAGQMADAGHVVRAFALLLPALGVAVVAWWIGDGVARLLLVANLLLPLLYSAPPFRLRRRGVWGALADTGAAHVLPAALVARLVTLHAPATEPAVVPFVAAAVGFSWLAGLRGTVVHEFAGRGDDELAGARTLGLTLDVVGARRLVLRWLLPAELTCLFVFLVVVLPSAPVTAVFLSALLVLEGMRVRRGWRLPRLEPAAPSRERYVPIVNNEIYEVWLPLGLASQLAFGHTGGWLLVVGQLVVFFPTVRTRAAEAYLTLRGERLPLQPVHAPVPAQKRHPRDGRTIDRSPVVIIAASSWTVNGVNVFSANLARGLQRLGIPAHILLTEEKTDLVRWRERRMPRPAGVQFCALPVHRTDGWGAHWGAMVRYLRDAAPCVYIPNSDWRHSVMCPRLPDDVVVVGVVHSDDPAHYDHVRRLGRYWNAIAVTSRAIAQRTAEECPSVADRIATIPIGARFPRELPARPPREGPLRLVYHGILKQHQKRVLDLPCIVRAALDLGVSVEMTIVGAGPDEDALRDASRALEAEGAIHFAGVVSPDDTPAILETHEVYVLASEFEGMPNALIEAMGHGCVPVVSRMTSGIPELVRDGENGYLVPIGDAGAFAERLRRLWSDRALLRQMSRRAHQTVRDGKFHVDDMVAAYVGVLDRAWNDVRSGSFKRAQGPLSPPPAEVAGVRVLPVDLPHAVPDLGRFASQDDAEDYAEQINTNTLNRSLARADRRLAIAAARDSLAGLRVFVSAPVWTCNGDNLWSEDLTRGLRDAGLDAMLLLTEESTDLVQIAEPRMARPTDIPVIELHVTGDDCWGARWGALLRKLEDAAPCVYFPGYDWRHSCIVPRLSDEVIVIGTLPNAGDLYTEHAARLGEFWNAAVAMRAGTTRAIRRRVPRLSERLMTVAEACVVPSRSPTDTLTTDVSVGIILVATSLAIRDLTTFANALRAGGVDTRFVAVDAPEDAQSGLEQLGIQIARRLNRQQWLALARDSRFVVSDGLNEGRRRRVTEAMGHGCVPVLVAPEDSDQDLVRDKISGLLVPPGAWIRAAEQIRSLASSPDDRLTMTERAHASATAEYGMDEMIDECMDVLRHSKAQVEVGQFSRRRGGVRPPPARIGDVEILPVELQYESALGRFPSRREARRFRQESSRWLGHLKRAR